MRWNRREITTPCDLGEPNANGYSTHRAVYEKSIGKRLPTHIDLDHLCRNRACRNVDHLEEVDRSTNLLRGSRSQKYVEKIDQIVALRNDGKSWRQISKDLSLGCHKSVRDWYERATSS